jgi:hypothetical protein
VREGVNLAARSGESRSGGRSITHRSDSTDSAISENLPSFRV